MIDFVGAILSNGYETQQAASIRNLMLQQEAALRPGSSFAELVAALEAERMRTLPARFADFKRRLAEAQARYA